MLYVDRLSYFNDKNPAKKDTNLQFLIVFIKILFLTCALFVFLLPITSIGELQSINLIGVSIVFSVFGKFIIILPFLKFFKMIIFIFVVKSVKSNVNSYPFKLRGKIVNKLQ